MAKLFNPILLLLLGSAAIAIYLTRYLAIQTIPSVDLPGHITLIEQIAQHRELFFYDRFSFSGYKPFYYYGFLAHLITALASIVTGIEVEMAVNLILVILTALLPLSIYYLCSSEGGSLWKVALSICMSILLLSHPNSGVGLGLGSILHIGLYPQVWGWHLMLLTLGCSLRLNQKWQFLAIIVLLSSLILTHSLTSVFILISLLTYGLINLPQLRSIVSAITLSLLSTIWWWMPALQNGEFASGNKLPGVSSTLLLFREFGWFALALIVLLGTQFLLKIRSDAIHRRVADPVKLFIGLLLVIAFFDTGLAYILVPLDVHIYRLQALSVVCFIGLLPAISSTYYRFNTIVGGVALSAMVVAIVMPLPEYSYMGTCEAHERYIDEDRVVEYLSNKQDISRVGFEYFNDYQLFNVLSPHYMPAKLASLRIETVNGLLIQGTRTPSFMSAAGSYLGVDFYAAEGEMLDVKQDIPYALQLFKWYGVNYLVLSNPFVGRVLQTQYHLPVKVIGRYFVARLGDPISLVEELNKPLIINRSGISFNNIQLEIFRAFTPAYLLEAIDDPIGQYVDYSPTIVLERDSNPESRFNYIAATLSKLDRNKFETNIMESIPQLKWCDDNQSLNVSGLIAGRMYRLNYSYFAGIKIIGATQVYRGQGDRIVFVADRHDVDLIF